MFREMAQQNTAKPLGFMLSILLFLCSFTVFLCAFSLEPTDRKCDLHTYPWSPAVDSIKYHWETFENVQFAIKTPYFGFVPTDKIEQAWDEMLPRMYSQTEIYHRLEKMKERIRKERDKANGDGLIH